MKQIRISMSDREATALKNLSFYFDWTMGYTVQQLIFLLLNVLSEPDRQLTDSEQLLANELLRYYHYSPLGVDRV